MEGAHSRQPGDPAKAAAARSRSPRQRQDTAAPGAGQRFRDALKGHLDSVGDESPASEPVGRDADFDA
ncbi:hypothetical protein AQJ11_28485 [Streptomyces corchorusii]|uniref:Uncharacterized protein n=2 Tax=Streptomyces TaxID=1883 RepID=A0A117QCN5_STRCK|nr:hypothetical protein [Streptomyces corchorusii]KUN21057.1 hypothetical protein AQJ11_28485 [Streptomyces corchorusii]